MPGLAIGGVCAACARILARRANRVGRLVAAGTSLLLAAYVMITLPPERTARLVGAVAVLLWYGLTFLIAKRVAWEWLE